MLLTIGTILCLLGAICMLGVAPSHTAAGIPPGFKMPDGFKTLITFSNAPNINLWERDLKPMGIDGGEMIPTSTMHNAEWRTFHPKQLKTADSLTFICAYDPNVFTDIVAQANKNQSLSFLYPTGAYVDFWGAMIKFEPTELKEGEFPTATVTIGVSNSDTSGNEAGPMFTPGSGT